MPCRAPGRGTAPSGGWAPRRRTLWRNPPCTWTSSPFWTRCRPCGRVRLSGRGLGRSRSPQSSTITRTGTCFSPAHPHTTRTLSEAPHIHTCAHAHMRARAHTQRQPLDGPVNFATPRGKKIDARPPLFSSGGGRLPFPAFFSTRPKPCLFHESQWDECGNVDAEAGQLLSQLASFGSNGSCSIQLLNQAILIPPRQEVASHPHSPASGGGSTERLLLVSHAARLAYWLLLAV